MGVRGLEKEIGNRGFRGRDWGLGFWREILVVGGIEREREGGREREIEYYRERLIGC